MQIENILRPVGRFFQAFGLGISQNPKYSLVIEPTGLIWLMNLKEPVVALPALTAFVAGNIYIIRQGYKTLRNRELYQELSRGGQLDRGPVEVA